MNRIASTSAPSAASLEPNIVPFVVAPHRIDADAAKVVKRLVRAGHLAYLVGGCVRDLLLNRPPKDFDVATSARPNEVRNLFRNCRIIGRRFRLAHVMFGPNKLIEVATFRKNPEGAELVDEWLPPPTGSDDGPDEGFGPDDEDTGAQGVSVLRAVRRPTRPAEDLLIRHDNVFGDPPEDAVRRDFTMNALFYDIERREVIDYVGGLVDIERRVIRTIGEADVRFREDPVRILRAIKFAARLDLGLDPDVFEAIVNHRDDLLRAARPRLLEEVLRLLRGGAARRSFWLMWETGVMSVLLPELSAFLDDDPVGRGRTWRRLGAVDEAVAVGRVPPDSVLFSALLLDPAEEYLQGTRDLVGAITEFFEEMQERLAMPRRLYDRVRQISVVQKRIRQGKLGSMTRRDWYHEAADLFRLDDDARADHTATLDDPAGEFGAPSLESP